MTETLETLSISCPSCHSPYDCSHMDGSGLIGSGYCQQCHTNLVFVEPQTGIERERRQTTTSWYQSVRMLAMTPIDRSFQIPSMLLGLFIFNFVILALAFSIFYLPAIRSFDPYDLDAYYLTPALL